MKSVDRTIALFELFAERTEPLTLSETARLLKLPVSTCFNLIRALQSAGYLYDVGGKSFYPTGRLLQIARQTAEHDPTRVKIAPQLELLRNQTGETVMLTKMVAQRIMILDAMLGTQVIRYTPTVGDFRALHTSASGKAVLSMMPELERAKIISKLKLLPLTAKSITDKAALLRDIQAGAERGWFLANGEGLVDVMSLARPLEIRKSVYTVSIVGPVYRMEPLLTQLAVKLVSRCERIVSVMRKG